MNGESMMFAEFDFNFLHAMRLFNYQKEFCRKYYKHNYTAIIALKNSSYKKSVVYAKFISLGVVMIEFLN